MKNLYRYIIALLLSCASFGTVAVAQTTDTVANYDDQIMLISEEAADDEGEEELENGIFIATGS